MRSFAVERLCFAAMIKSDPFNLAVDAGFGPHASAAAVAA